MFFYDSTILLLIPALLIASYAQYKVSSTFSKFSKIPNKNGYTGGEVARIILDRHGLSDIPVIPVRGQLTDHYDPNKKSISLSEPVYNSSSISSIAVAAHEVGHAIQDQEGYMALRLRNSLVPVVNFSSQMVWILFLAGIFFSLPKLVTAGILLFTTTVAFQIITLPVEINASRRAMASLSQGDFVDQQEYGQATKVLKAAAFTYIASTLVALTQLLRLILINNRRR
ncbi:MAG: zinc metallopeptidase [Tissierellia bacterium]|nr:zinc metallopeptidase [Tissierellia bacterium]